MAFLLAGTIKLTPVFGLRDVHRQVRADSHAWPTILGLGVSPGQLRIGIAVAQMALALLLLTSLDVVASLLLILNMLAAAYSHVQMGESPAQPLLSVTVLISFLVCNSMSQKNVKWSDASKT